MTRPTCFLLFLALALSVSSQAPAIPLDTRRLGALSAIERASNASDRTGADSLARAYIARWPEDPTGYYSLAVARVAAALGCEAERDLTEVDRELEQAEAVARLRLADRPDDIWTRYMLGLTLGFQAVRAVQTGRLWSAWRTSVHSVEQLEEVRTRDPLFIDPLLPLGAYNFWRGRTVAPYAWLPLIRDTREQGIAEMKHAAYRGTTTGVSARNMLVWALIDYDRPEEALAIADTLLDRFPDNRSLLWARAEALKAADRWDDAAQAFLAALATFDSEPDDCVGKQILKAKYGVVLAGLGRCREAYPILLEARSYSPPESAEDQFRDVWKEVDEAMTWCAPGDLE